MEFCLEPSGSITITRGDLLLTLIEDHGQEVFITVMLMRWNYVCFNATDRPRGNFFFVRETDDRIRFDIDNGNLFGLLMDSDSSDKWHLLPQTLCGCITDMLDKYIY